MTAAEELLLSIVDQWATICTRETVVSTAAIFAFERTLSGLNEQFNIEVPSALDSLMIGNRKVIDVLNSIAFAIGHNIRVDRPILRTEIARVMEENGLPYKPNEVIGICEFCERHLAESLTEPMGAVDSNKLMAGYYEASDDFLSVNYCDDTGEIHRFSFNHKQAKVVSIYAARKFPVSDRDMLNELGEQESVSSRLRDVFKGSDNSVHEAWGTFIVPDSSGKSPVKRKLNAKKT